MKTTTNKLIRTLTMDQLLKRWSHENLSPENILELADQGCFGVYLKPMIDRATYYDIGGTANSNSDEQKIQFQQFEKKYPYLLDSKPGYERLATSIEITLYSLCKSTAIEQLLKKGKIFPSEYNNTFGIKKEGNKFICCSYFFGRKNFTKDDLFFFIDQIECYEKQKSAQAVKMPPTVEKKNLPEENEPQENAQAEQLSRAAIKKLFKDGEKRLNNSKWKYIFDNEKTNGLINVKRKKQGNKWIYNQEELLGWLVSNAYFTPQEIKKILGISENSKKIFSWEKIQGQY